MMTDSSFLRVKILAAWEREFRDAEAAEPAAGGRPITGCNV